MTFQERLRYYRESAGFKSAKEFAAALGIGYTTYVAYENKNREPRYSMLCKIAHMLKITPNELLGFHDTETELETAVSFMERLGFKIAKGKAPDGHFFFTVNYTQVQENERYEETAFYVQSETAMIDIYNKVKKDPRIISAYRDVYINMLTFYLYASFKDRFKSYLPNLDSLNTDKK